MKLYNGHPQYYSIWPISMKAGKTGHNSISFFFRMLKKYHVINCCYETVHWSAAGQMICIDQLKIFLKSNSKSFKVNNHRVLILLMWLTQL